MIDKKAMKGKVEHYEKYEELSRAIGVERLKSLVLSFFGEENLRKAYEEDEHLNSIPLRIWDSLEPRVRPCKEVIRNTKVNWWALSTNTCVLKHVARYHVLQLAPPSF